MRGLCIPSTSPLLDTPIHRFSGAMLLSGIWQHLPTGGRQAAQCPCCACHLAANAVPAAHYFCRGGPDDIWGGCSPPPVHAFLLLTSFFFLSGKMKQAVFHPIFPCFVNQLFCGGGGFTEVFSPVCTERSLFFPKNPHSSPPVSSGLPPKFSLLHDGCFSLHAVSNGLPCFSVSCSLPPTKKQTRSKPAVFCAQHVYLLLTHKVYRLTTIVLL